MHSGNVQPVSPNGCVHSKNNLRGSGPVSPNEYPYYTGQGGPLQDAISASPYLQTPQISLDPNGNPHFTDPFYATNPFGSKFSTPMTLLVLSPTLSLY